MAIPETQLDTWSHVGSQAQSAATYQTIKSVLEDRRAPYAGRNFVIRLQGSYANDTNIRGVDSDVDMYIRCDDAFQYELDELDASAKARWQQAFPGTAGYGYIQFQAEVMDWLRQYYGNAAQPGSKAIHIAGDGSRRNADVLPCIEYRRYTWFNSSADQHHYKGICFYRQPDNTKIHNFPAQHSDNCTTKHQATNQWFKPTVRVLKNMRNRMIDRNLLVKGVAPSYFLEGLLWNVPNNNYGVSYNSTISPAITWIAQADKTQLVCANGLHWLLRENSPVSWSPAKFTVFFNALVDYWYKGVV